MRESTDRQINLDLDRIERCGHPEVVYCPGKTPQQIAVALGQLRDAHGLGLATRAEPDQAAAVGELHPELVHDPVARILRLGNPLGSATGRTVAILSAGTSDGPVAEEGSVTLESFGVDVLRFPDVGVAGLHRLLGVVEQVRECDAAIVVAGMEGALPSVVAGLIDIPVIAVPTSTGYGVGAGGRVALDGMLSSCAAGVVVVNIDNGFGAAMAILRLLSLDRRRTTNHVSENRSE